MQQESVRDLLKKETANLHVATEGAIKIMDSDFTLEHYKSLIKKFYGFYRPLENSLKDHAEIPVSLDWASRQKTHLLQKDLAALSITDETPIPHRLPIINSKASLLGTLYVLEGSTLGGQVISKHISERFNITHETGGSFFNAYGPRTGVMWRQFISVLDTEIKTDFEKSEAVHAAKNTFICLGEWL